MAETMWECVLCGSCSNDCATGYEPPVFIREARTIAIVENLVPKNVEELYKTMLEKNNIYGIDVNLKYDKIKDILEGLPEKADTLLYIGEVAAIRTPDIVKSVFGLLKKAGINFTVLADEPSSGAYLGDFVGFVEDVRSLGAILSKRINESGAKTVIAIDPIDVRIMKHEYAEWNIAPKAQVVTATSYFAELIRTGKLNPIKLEGLSHYTIQVYYLAIWTKLSLHAIFWLQWG